MAEAALSNRDRKELNRQRKERLSRRTVVGAAPKPRKADDEEMDGRDGLLWLKQKGRLSPTQVKAALWCSDRIRDAGDVSIPSCIAGGVGGGDGDAVPNRLVSMTTAKRELFVLRYQVLRGVVDMVLVVDGVCGARHTLRYLAGGDKHRARDLEVTLKNALDMVAAYLAEPKTGD